MARSLFDAGWIDAGLIVAGRNAAVVNNRMIICRLVSVLNIINKPESCPIGSYDRRAVKSM